MVTSLITRGGGFCNLITAPHLCYFSIISARAVFAENGAKYFTKRTSILLDSISIISPLEQRFLPRCNLIKSSSFLHFSKKKRVCSCSLRCVQHRVSVFAQRHLIKLAGAKVFVLRGAGANLVF